MRPIDIIVPIHRNASLVKICVDSLLAHFEEIAQRRPQLILIDDSPGDVDVAQLLDQYAITAFPVLVLRNEVNLGFVRTINRGLAIAREGGHDALLVNSDTVTFEGTLTKLLEAANADPQIGFACPRSNNASICSLPHLQSASSGTSDDAYRQWKALAGTLPAFHFVPTAVGFYLFIAHAVIANVGSFSEGFGVGYEEENDLVMRAGKLGYRAVMANHAFAYHAGAASFDLTGLDLAQHRHGNLLKLVGLHPEFLPLLARYECSPHFQAERLIAGLLPDARKRTKVIFDLSDLAPQSDNTSPNGIALIGALARRHGHRLLISTLCTARSFEIHGLAAVPGVLREEPGAPGLHGVAILLQPRLNIEDLQRLNGLAPINLFVIHDSLGEDCVPIALARADGPLWDYVGERSHGLIFLSHSARNAFCARHPAALALPHFTRLPSTRLAATGSIRAATTRPALVLVYGTEFAHDGVEAAIAVLSAALPNSRVVGLNPSPSARSSRPSASFGELIAQASLLVIPAYCSGFPEALLEGLASAVPVVARTLPMTVEILATLDQVSGVYLFDSNAGLASAAAEALAAETSSAIDRRAASLDDWADGFADFCLGQAAHPDVFIRLVSRLSATQRIRLSGSVSPEPQSGMHEAPAAKATDLDTLLSMDGREFVAHAYATLLLRSADGSGYEFYLGQLRDGIGKLDILRALAISPEGRARGVKLQGLEERLKAQSSFVARLLRRLFALASTTRRDQGNTR